MQIFKCLQKDKKRMKTEGFRSTKNWCRYLYEVQSTSIIRRRGGLFRSSYVLGKGLSRERIGKTSTEVTPNKKCG